MRRGLFTFLFLLSCGGWGAAGEIQKNQARATAWREEGSGDHLIIYSRTRAGSALKEFKTVGTINAPASTVFAVLQDAEAYPSFMPFTSECRVLQRESDFTVAYQRLELPLVSDRDYTLRSEHSQKPGPHGPIYLIRWEPANELGPAEKPGVQRVKVCEGGWLIEPDGKGGTRATYRIYTDSGGFIPAAIADTGSRAAIRKVFAAIREEVHEEKYADPKG